MSMYEIESLVQGCPTGGPGARCGPQPIFMWPSKASQIKLFCIFFLYELEWKSILLNVLFLYMLKTCSLQ